MIDLGTVRPGSTVLIPFSSYAKTDGATIGMTGFTTADVLVGTTAFGYRSSTSGVTAITDWGGIGKHLITLNLADAAVAGFYRAGTDYIVAIDTVVIDGVTTGGWIARFRIGYPGAWYDTYVTGVTALQVTLAGGPAEDDVFNGHWAIVHNAASPTKFSRVLIVDYIGATKTVVLAAAPTFALGANDNFSIMGPAPLQASVLGRAVAVDPAGLVDATAVKVGPSGTATPQTARDLGASVLVSPGTGPGQLDVTAGVVKAQVAQYDAALDLSAPMKASVKAEVVTALDVDTYPEVGQEAPAATQSIRKMLALLYKAFRNRATQSATDYKLYGDDGVTVHQKRTVSENAGVFDSGEVGTGP